MSLVSNPTTFTVPALTPPLVIVASDPKRVLPNPLRLATVNVPVLALKFTLFNPRFALLTAPTLNPAPLTLANPLPSTVSVAAPL
jgi:hypothetical protein